MRRTIEFLIVILLVGTVAFFYTDRQHVFHVMTGTKTFAADNVLEYTVKIVDYMLENRKELTHAEYLDTICFFVESLDSCALYAELTDASLNTIAPKVITIEPDWTFRFKGNPKLVKQMQASREKGQAFVYSSDAVPVKMYIRWQWIQLETADDYVLFVVGIPCSREDADWMSVIILVIFNAAILFVLWHLMTGKIHVSRDKLLSEAERLEL